MRRLSTSAVATILTAVLFLGCVSTEEMGDTKPATPQQVSTPAETSTVAGQATPPGEASHAPQSRKADRKPPFRTKRDTIVASVVTRSRSATIRRKKIERPTNPAYTVQIGAFSKAPNALQLQKIAKERFSGHPVFNMFNTDDKIYRVSVGKFDTRQEASMLRREIMKAFPKDYAQCWVNYIAR
ncbi:MAG TPA: SPOR domain-containing protein [Bacteroidota bacterium]|nr:SPOR domain-containing protein [Bacteroidota bacterium]